MESGTDETRPKPGAAVENSLRRLRVVHRAQTALLVACTLVAFAVAFLSVSRARPIESDRARETVTTVELARLRADAEAARADLWAGAAARRELGPVVRQFRGRLGALSDRAERLIEDERSGGDDDEEPVAEAIEQAIVDAHAAVSEIPPRGGTTLAWTLAVDESVERLDESLEDWIASNHQQAGTASRALGRQLDRLPLVIGLLALVALLGAALAQRRHSRTAEDLERRFEEIAGRVALDPLTGLLNHREFRRRLEDETARAQRDDRALSLVLLDVDHFKRVNSTAGHQAGDELLAAIGAVLREVAGAGHLLGRVGGEEFAWLLPGLDAEAAREAADRARRSVASISLRELGAPTISAGVCDLRLAGDAQSLYNRADTALFWAKRHGRNSVALYSETAMRALNSGERARRVDQEGALAAINTLTRTVELRDESRAGHGERVARLAARLAEVIGWSDGEVRLMYEAAQVHDVGRIALPDDLVRTPGPLTLEEFERVRRHVEFASTILDPVLDAQQVAWVRHHNERWDGGGYPDGLAGDRVPGGAQLLGIADAWVAMTSARPHRRALSAEEARREIARESGGRFDPQLVRLFLRHVRSEDAHAEPGEGVSSARPGAAERSVASRAEMRTPPSSG